MESSSTHEEKERLAGGWRDVRAGEGDSLQASERVSVPRGKDSNECQHVLTVRLVQMARSVSEERERERC